MRFLVLILSLLFSSSIIAREFCAKLTENSYTFKLPHDVCQDMNNCWIGLVSPEDTFELIVNGETKLNLKNSSTYVGPESFYIQIQNQPKEISLNTFDLNQAFRAPKEDCLYAGPLQEVKVATAFKWFFKTGANLASLYSLIIISLFLFSALIIRKDALGVALLRYSLICTVYLFSFSEYPRLFFDPVLLSGVIHFPIRLSQDFALISLLFHFYRAYEYTPLYKKISYLYFTAFAIYFLMAVTGIKNYSYAHLLIILLSPLEAAPFAAGFYFATQTKDRFEKKILVPAFAIFFLLQINDLFTFWGIYPTYFTVRLYIPVIVTLILFIYFRRIYQASLSAKIYQEKQKLTQRFIHDLKSPLSAIKVMALDGLKEHAERSILVKTAIERIEEMANSLAFETNEEVKPQSIPLVSLIEEIIEQKKFEYKNMEVLSDFPNEIFCFVDDTALARVISNIINNGIEAQEKAHPKLSFTIIEDENRVKLIIKDYGKGMSPELIQKALQGDFTSKVHGRGIGLSSSVKIIRDMGGDLAIFSKTNKGTTIEMTIPRGDVPFWYHTDITSADSFVEIPVERILNDYLMNVTPLLSGVVYVGKFTYDKNFFKFLEDRSLRIVNLKELKSSRGSNKKTDYILVEDDKYVRKTWELRMRDKGKSLITFSSYQDFQNSCNELDKGAKLFLDRQIGEIDILDHVEGIRTLGFNDITIITSETLDRVKLGLDLKYLNSKLPPD